MFADAEHGHDVVALVHGAAADLGVLHRDADDGHHRRLPAQQLLDRGGDDRRVVDDLLPVLGVLDEEAEHAVERRGDGVEPGDEEQEADVEDLFAGQALAVDLGVEEAADEVVCDARPCARR